ncbi:hypothetical protein [Tepidicella xavieri]|jgi:hypothetical protein|uniref:Uncharacterized protein n=1 Tax=Tepidicella xavieri TaxID=360241 RepID=A0A4R6UBU1_9BURK|nr:hypothetical protein [Tepidicella xavieri]TDQ42533.1 hypothetical protein DFR43_109103 [Tepidicella xavieri]
MTAYASTSAPVAGAPSRPSARRTDRPLAALLLAAAVAALAVATDRLMASWADEHLLATWVAMWAVVFAGSLLLAGTARRAAQRLLTLLDGWARARAAARADARLLVLARHDPRVMADLQAARDRADLTVHTEALAPLGLPEVSRRSAIDPAREWNWEAGAVVDMDGRRRMVPFYV